MPVRAIFIGLLIALLPHAGRADESWLERGWALTAFAGRLTTDSVTNEILVAEAEFEDAGAVGLAASKDLFRVGDYLRFALEAQVLKHFGDQDHWEFNFPLVARWTEFPWNHLVPTTIALGDGPSIPTETPELERRRRPQESAQVLNYVLGEITLGLPQLPRWSLALRFHHRSGVFELIDDVGEASTILAAGVKFRF